MRNYIMQAMIILVVGFSSAILLPSIASAHDIWLTEGPGHVIQIDFGDLSARQLADVRKLVTLTLIGADGKVDLRATLPTPSEAHGHPVLVSQPIKAPPGSVVEVSYDNGFWITAPGDKLETNASSLMIPNGTGKHWTVKYAKLLLGFGSYTKVLGKRAELVAMRDPFTNADATLPVKLLLDGKPYAGARRGPGLVLLSPPRNCAAATNYLGIDRGARLNSPHGPERLLCLACSPLLLTLAWVCAPPRELMRSGLSATGSRFHCASGRLLAVPGQSLRSPDAVLAGK